MWLSDFSGIIQTILFTGAKGLCASAILYVLFWLLTKKRQIVPFKTHFLRYIFLTYVICVIILTLFSDSDGAGNANFIPFQSVCYALNSGFETATYLIVLNVIMFIPMGVLLPCVFRNLDKFYKIVLISFVVSFLIEIIQILLPSRIFDIDDILMNTLGGAIGYALFSVCIWIFQKREQKTATRIISVAVLAIIPVFIAVIAFTSSAREFSDPLFHNPMAPKEIELAVSADYPASAMVYQIEKTEPEKKMKIFLDKFGMNGKITDEGSFLKCKDKGKSLSISKEDSFWMYSLRETNNQSTALSEKELQEEAEKLIKALGLWEDFWTLDAINDIQTDISGADGWEISIDPNTGEEILPKSVIITGKAVTFKVDVTSQNIGLITVFFDGEGCYEIDSSFTKYIPYKEVELMSPEDSIDAFYKTGRCYIESDIFDSYKALIDNVALDYMESNEQKYRVPVWKMTGSFYGMDVSGKETESRGNIMIYAAK